MTVSPGDVVRCSVRQRGPFGQDIVNVWHYQHVGSNPIADSAALTGFATYIDLIYAVFENSITNTQIPVDLKLDTVQASAGQWAITYNIGTIEWGDTYIPGSAAQVYANGVAALGFVRTLVGKVFGRKFLGILTESEIEGNGVLTALCLGAVVSTMEEALLGIVAGGEGFALGIPSTRTLQFEEAFSVDATAEPAYQRRRSVRSGS